MHRIQGNDEKDFELHGEFETTATGYECGKENSTRVKKHDGVGGPP